LTPEQAKARLLHPPVEPEGPGWLSQNAPWLCLVAAVAGFAAARPIRIGKVTGRVAGGAAGLAAALVKSPMVRKAALSYAMSVGQRFKRNGSISFHS